MGHERQKFRLRAVSGPGCEVSVRCRLGVSDPLRRSALNVQRSTLQRCNVQISRDEIDERAGSWYYTCINEGGSYVKNVTNGAFSSIYWSPESCCGRSGHQSGRNGFTSRLQSGTSSDIDTPRLCAFSTSWLRKSARPTPFNRVSSVPLPCARDGGWPSIDVRRIATVAGSASVSALLAGVLNSA
jgi:hypothetical protein